MGEVRVPELGESIVEATVLRWLKEVGSTVGLGEALAELETDKVNVEVIADEEGVLASIMKQAGDTVAVGEAIGVISAASESGTQPSTSPEASTSPQAGALPQAGTSPQGGGTQAGGVLAQDVSSVPVEPNPGRSSDVVPTNAQSSLGLPLSEATAPPSIRKLARERGIDLSQINNPRDLAATGSGRTQVSPERQTPVDGTTAVPQKEERVKMSRRRLTIAKRLVETQKRAAMLTTFNEVDMTSIMEVRKRRKDNFREQHGVSLGFMSFFTKAVVGALKAFPLLNAEISGDEMILKKHYDIGVAVSTEGGLVVPVVRDADRMNFAEIEQEIARLAKRARDNALSLSDLQGGTFTITNGGVFGSLFSTPILNGTQVGILGMHGIVQRPIAVNGQVEIRPMMYIALSYDHRIVDGAEAVQFLVRVKQLVEDPESLLIEG